MQNALETKNVVATCFGNEMMKTMLPHLLEQLELCQKSLSAYLETKRAEFPRFYFVSDPTLLEILSLGSDPPSVVPHFQSGLFDSLTNVSFDKVDKTKMTEMFSQQGEKVEFERPVEAKGMLHTCHNAFYGLLRVYTHCLSTPTVCAFVCLSTPTVCLRWKFFAFLLSSCMLVAVHAIPEPLG